MTTICMPRNRFNPFPLLLGIIICVIVLASVHAVMAHGQAAMTAQNCFNGGGQVMKQVMQDPLTFRQMRFCNQQGHWFVSIDAHDGGNVTMFPRSMAKCLREVLDYAIHSGFTEPIQ